MIEIEGISLETEGKDIVVYAAINGAWVEIIRTCQDGSISHAVTDIGILGAAHRRILMSTPKMFMGRA